MNNTKIPKEWNIPEKMRRRFGKNGVGKQRSMYLDEHLLIILHQAPDSETKSRTARIYWRNPQGQWKSSQGGKDIYHLRQHIEDYSKREIVLDKLYEEATTPEHYFDLLEELTPLVRSSQNMTNALQQAREYVEDEDIIDLRDRCQEIAREVEILNTDARHGLDYQVAKRAEEQARYSMQNLKSTDRLNVLVAIFLPVTAISGIFGMNLKIGLEDVPATISWMIMIGSFLLGFAVKAWVIPSKKNNET
ncbi:MAG: CorA family divalent cation transporter [Lentisphaerales bacterium]|nr:CorA family divalent cation transporter [Lentisphaerales bacterium]